MVKLVSPEREVRFDAKTLLVIDLLATLVVALEGQ